MPRSPQPPLPGLLAMAQLKLGHTQSTMGKQYGASRNTVRRWQTGHSQPLPTTIVQVARDVYEQDPALAEQIAGALGHSLAALGIGAPAPQPAPPPPPPPAAPSPMMVRHLADGVLLAVAELDDRPASALRPLVVAAFERAAAVGLSVDEVLAGLRLAVKKEDANATPAT